ncbi:MAG: pilin [Patescibacteria group bacterium]
MKFIYKLVEHKAILSLVFVLVFGFLLTPMLKVNAAPDDEATASSYSYDEADPFGVGIIEDGEGTDGGIALGTQDLRTTITNIINVLLSLLGIVAVVVILIGGFKWMTAGGNDDQVGEAKKFIFSGIIGLAIILSSWAIAKFALGALGTATNTTGAENY